MTNEINKLIEKNQKTKLKIEEALIILNKLKDIAIQKNYKEKNEILYLIDLLEEGK